MNRPFRSSLPDAATYILAVLAVLLIGGGLACGRMTDATIDELIRPVNLTAGEADTLLLSDLFYAPHYYVRFGGHPHIAAAYDPVTRDLALQPGRHFEGFTTFAFELEGETYHLPIYSRIKQEHVFRYQPESPPEYRMNVMGNFNDWNRNSLPMHDRDGDGVYERAVALEPGQYFYQFVIDDREIWDPENPDRVDNGFGSYNSVLFIPPRHMDKAFLHILDWRTVGDEVRINFHYERENQPGPLTAEDVTVLLDNGRWPEEGVRLSGNRLEVVLKEGALKGRHALRAVVTQAGQSTNLQTVWLEDGRPLGQGEGMESWYDAVLYSLMVDRFHDGDPQNSVPIEHDSLDPRVNYQGGDLQGILEKLKAGYFDSLGVNALWLSPVVENTDDVRREWPPPHRFFSAYHGYWPVHHERVDEHFGSLALFKQLVETAHARDMKVLLDFVANHVYEDHPFYQEHPEWFGTVKLPDGRMNIRLWDEHRLTTWFEPFMPSFAYQTSDAALQVMTDNAVWWVRETGIDGFRHDAVKHIPNRFWRVLTRKLKRQVEGPEGRRLYQIGETFGSYELISSYVNNGQLDAQFNFNLYDVALPVFLNPEGNFQTLATELEKTFRVYGDQHLMGNVMDSHDKVRYMAYADGDLELNSSEAKEMAWTNPPQVDDPASYERAELYLAYILTIPGVPTLYYGDEIGMTGAADPDNRRIMRFGEQLRPEERRMLEDVRRLVHLRRQHSALRYGDFQTLQAEGDVWLYLRSDLHERLLVALNKAPQPRTLTVELPEVYAVSTARDVVENRLVPITEGRMAARLPARSWRIYELQ